MKYKKEIIEIYQQIEFFVGKCGNSLFTFTDHIGNMLKSAFPVLTAIQRTNHATDR